MGHIAEHIIIRIAEEFANTPGSRNIDEGSFSGEEFLNSTLRPAFEKALHQKSKILIDLDNTEGYATSFLEEAFGGLARIFGSKIVMRVLEFKSLDEPLLIEEIITYIKEAKDKLP